MNETVLYENNDNLSEEAKILQNIFAPGNWGAKLLTPISKASFYSYRLANAFKQFPDNADLGETFTLVELLSCAELLYGRADTMAKEGDAVYVLLEPVKDLHLMASLMRNSVSGICALLQATRGVELTVPMGMEFERFLQGRFLILRQKDGERFCATSLVKMARVGTLCHGRLRVVSSGNVLADFDLATLLPASPLELDFTPLEEEAFEQALMGALSYSCCCFGSGDYYVNLPADLPMATFTACCIGLFQAMMQYRFALPPVRYFPNGRIGLVVPKPYVTDGDGVFAFRPKTGNDGMPIAGELMKLQRYLAENVKLGKIKSVLPLKKNALEMMSKLGDGEVDYVPSREFPTDGFSVLAIMSTGTDVPATKLGEFQYKASSI